MTGRERSFDRWDEAVRLFVDVSTRSGSQIAAIREVRERFGLDLVTAKEVAARAEGFRDLAAKEAELVGPARAALAELEEEELRGQGTIRLMADYDCHPLWSESGDNLAPRSLLLSNVLVRDLELWASEYDATLNREDPSASGFESAESARAFLRAGRELARRVEAELGGTCRVTSSDPNQDAPHLLVRPRPAPSNRR